MGSILIPTSGGGVPAAHASTHENGGSDEINVAGLSGVLADAQTPTAHAASHTNGTDDIANFVGDSGLGGTKGLVPAPSAGDAAADKVLKANGTWSTPSVTPAGADKQIQFNDGGYLNASANLTFDKTEGRLNSGLFAGTATNTGKGSVVLGDARASGTISSTSYGSIAGGFAKGSNGYSAYVTSSHFGSICVGGAYGGPAATANSSLIASSTGSLVMGKAVMGRIEAKASGSIAQGFANGAGSLIETSNNGAFAMGHAKSGAQIKTGAEGSMSRGYAIGSSCYIRTSGKGATSFGYANGAYALIESTGDGSLACGYAYGSNNIVSSGAGSFAFGVATGADITASANSSMQIGEGTNSQATSISVGGGVRINGSAAPTTPRNGDIWVASGYTYIRSNGVSVKIV